MSSFLTRWSKRAAEARQSRETEFADPTIELPVESSSALQTSEPATEREPDLPDPETLDADSDYRPFLRRSVAPALRRLALRRLWRSDPLLANLDGLNDYDDDFAALHRSGAEAIADAIRAGRKYARAPGGSTDDSLSPVAGAQPDTHDEQLQDSEATAFAAANPDPEEASG